MGVRCPHCNRPMPRHEGSWQGWSVNLDANTAQGPTGAVVQLSRREAELLQILVAARGSVVPHERIYALLWGIRPPEDPASNVRVFVSHIRRALEAYGVTLRSMKDVGYSFRAG